MMLAQRCRGPKPQLTQGMNAGHHPLELERKKALAMQLKKHEAAIEAAQTSSAQRGPLITKLNEEIGQAQRELAQYIPDEL
eukprot:6526549-Pyramimonas_sp.AAC.1